MVLVVVLGVERVYVRGDARTPPDHRHHRCRHACLPAKHLFVSSCGALAGLFFPGAAVLAALSAFSALSMIILLRRLPQLNRWTPGSLTLICPTSIREELIGMLREVIADERGAYESPPANEWHSSRRQS